MKIRLDIKQLIPIGLTLISIVFFFINCSEDSTSPTNNRVGIDPAIADSAINAFNDAFLTTSGDRIYYKMALNNNDPDETWKLAIDIQGMEDVYERTGNSSHRTLVDELCKSYMKIVYPPWDWNPWNDDLAWYGLVVARGYQMTGTASLLTRAEYTFNYTFDRGWDTQYNGGGIYERQPDMVPPGTEIIKEALSNNPLGLLACMLYQSTGNEDYLTKAKMIYDWSRAHIFNPATGEVYRGIYRDNSISYAPSVYNQGTFIDFTASLYKITGDSKYYDDAVMAINYTLINLTNNGIISNSASYLATWAAEFIRGLGHLCKLDPKLWDTYGDWMIKNANAAWGCRRTDLNLAWNGWTSATPIDPAGLPTWYVSAVAWLQFTAKQD